MEYRSELSADAIDALLSAFPHGRGWVPTVMYVAASAVPYRGLLRRATPNGPDEVYCGDYHTERKAWEACAATGLRMLEAWESGDTALMALMRASIRYARPATPAQWADLRATERRLWDAIGGDGGGGVEGGNRG